MVQKIYARGVFGPNLNLMWADQLYLSDIEENCTICKLQICSSVISELTKYSDRPCLAILKIILEGVKA